MYGTTSGESSAGSRGTGFRHKSDGSKSSPAAINANDASGQNRQQLPECAFCNRADSPGTTWQVPASW